MLLSMMCSSTPNPTHPIPHKTPSPLSASRYTSLSHSPLASTYPQIVIRCFGVTHPIYISIIPLTWVTSMQSWTINTFPPHSYYHSNYWTPPTKTHTHSHAHLRTHKNPWEYMGTHDNTWEYIWAQSAWLSDYCVCLYFHRSHIPLSPSLII
jgi:hypothetical protein